MNYHNIIYNDMNNGSGLRVTLFVSGCEHHCIKCQNPQTWNSDGGIAFDKRAFEEIINELSNDYISGITFSGGDPLHKKNIDTVWKICKLITEEFPSKTIWLYTGFRWEDIFINSTTLQFIDPHQIKMQSVLEYL